MNINISVKATNSGIKCGYDINKEDACLAEMVFVKLLTDEIDKIVEGMDMTAVSLAKLVDDCKKSIDSKNKS